MDVAEIISHFGLQPHPEGGFYRETAYQKPREYNIPLYVYGTIRLLQQSTARKVKP